MPRFSSVFSSLQAKIEEARISDLNYELGRALESTKCYFSSTFKAGSTVSSTVRSSVPKSTSLPLFPSAVGFGHSKCHDSSKYSIETSSGKYKYRSSFKPPSDDDLFGHSTDEIIEEEEGNEDTDLTDSTVVEKFIRVLESSAARDKGNDKHSASLPISNTREDIRRKLAFNVKGDPVPSVKPQKVANDLEVCFINEVLEEENAEIEHNTSSCSLNRSQSECISLQSLGLARASKGPSENHSCSNVAYQLARCQQIAHRKMVVEKRNRTFHEVNTFNKLIGRSLEGKLTGDILWQMNTATIQVIVNDFHDKIERLNEELVKELMKKDELQASIIK